MWNHLHMDIKMDDIDGLNYHIFKCWNDIFWFIKIDGNQNIKYINIKDDGCKIMWLNSDG